MRFKTNKLIKSLISASFAWGMLLALPPAYAKSDPAADYPKGAVTIVVGFPPGGATDVIARVVADHLGQAFGHPVLVRNEPGAGSNIATERVIRSKPDGHTLLVETIANATNMSVYKDIRYDTEKDLMPIVMLMTSPSILTINSSIPATTLDDLIKLAKEEPGRYSFASSGVGGSPHLAGEMLKLRTGMDLLHVPYNGATPALNDVLGGVVDMGFKTSMGVMQYVSTDRLRAIAVASPTRLKDLPDIPTMAEAGFDDFHVLSWNGLAAPAGTPSPIIDKINAEVNRILLLPEVQKRMASLGADPGGGTPEEFGGFVSAEIKKWGDVVRDANVELN